MNEFTKKNSIPSADLIKIDVEGMEWEVLSAGLDYIQSSFPVIVSETHRGASDMMKYDCLTPLFEALYKLGYLSYYVNDDGNFENFIYPNFRTDTFYNLIDRNY
jgi:hypothetical protein